MNTSLAKMKIKWVLPNQDLMSKKFRRNKINFHYFSPAVGRSPRRICHRPGRSSLRISEEASKLPTQGASTTLSPLSLQVPRKSSLVEFWIARIRCPHQRRRTSSKSNRRRWVITMSRIQPSGYCSGGNMAWRGKTKYLFAKATSASKRHLLSEAGLRTQTTTHTCFIWSSRLRRSIFLERIESGITNK